ncbi:hypothetical protein CE91St41_37980 [Oscillospiraceae bacterium]|nr:hypothetical protein CE91St40_37960 [Oscillospiraceae bacterium]BDF76909.1 hypothetical protein CE91St41_37980 [Oscillospiraceae bacterium]
MRIQPPGRGLRSTLVALLCALFFLLAMGTALLSSGVYRAAAAASDENYAQRTSLSYLANQIRRADGAVGVGTFGGADALVIYEGDYVTLIYCWDGQLRELYTEPGTGLLPADGEGILPVASLTISASGALLTLTADGDSVAVSPRLGWEDAGEVAL